MMILRLLLPHVCLILGTVGLRLNSQFVGKNEGKLVIGVVSDVRRPELRARLRTFYRTRFGDLLDSGVRLEFIVSKNLYPKNLSKTVSESEQHLFKSLEEESQKEGDIVWMDSIEFASHVNPSTIKTGRWFQSLAEKPYQYYCKADDDSLVNINLLLNILEQNGPSAYLGNIHFREFYPDYKFQACGALQQPYCYDGVRCVDSSYKVQPALENLPKMRDVRKTCSESVGPFPKAAGSLECMGKTVAHLLAKDAHYESFLKEAKRRDELGKECRTTQACQNMPWETHMWNSEDQGISYNLFRSVVRNNLHVKIVNIHNRHWNGESDQKEFVTRISKMKINPVVVVHRAKNIPWMDYYDKEWDTNISPEFHQDKTLCNSCEQYYGWKSAMTCSSGEGDSCDAFTEINPSKHFQCCEVTGGVNYVNVLRPWKQLPNKSHVDTGSASWDELFSDRLLPDYLQSRHEAHVSQLPEDFIRLFDLWHKPKGSIRFSENLFPDCAMVGSSASLVKKGYQHIIDEHYPVIRVNRLPSKDYFQDFGSRTDIFFGNRWESKNGKLSVMGPPSKDCKDEGHPTCYKSVNCTAGISGSEVQCPTDAILFRRWGPDQNENEDWKKSRIPVGTNAWNIGTALEQSRHHGKQCSTGMLAFLLFAPMCKQLTLYGFEGTQNADGHKMEDWGNLEKEHAFYQIAAKSELTENVFKKMDTTTAWLIERINKNKIMLM